MVHHEAAMWRTTKLPYGAREDCHVAPQEAAFWRTTKLYCGASQSCDVAHHKHTKKNQKRSLNIPQIGPNYRVPSESNARKGRRLSNGNNSEERDRKRHANASDPCQPRFLTRQIDRDPAVGGRHIRTPSRKFRRAEGSRLRKLAPPRSGPSQH